MAKAFDSSGAPPGRERRTRLQEHNIALSAGDVTSPAPCNERSVRHIDKMRPDVEPTWQMSAGFAPILDDAPPRVGIGPMWSECERIRPKSDRRPNAARGRPSLGRGRECWPEFGSTRTKPGGTVSPPAPPDWGQRTAHKRLRRFPKRCDSRDVWMSGHFRESQLLGNGGLVSQRRGPDAPVVGRRAGGAQASNLGPVTHTKSPQRVWRPSSWAAFRQLRLSGGVDLLGASLAEDPWECRSEVRLGAPCRCEAPPPPISKRFGVGGDPESIWGRAGEELGSV